MMTMEPPETPSTARMGSCEPPLRLRMILLTCLALLGAVLAALLVIVPTKRTP